MSRITWQECGSALAACAFSGGHLCLAFRSAGLTQQQLVLKYWWFYLLGTAVFIAVLAVLRTQGRNNAN